MYASSRNSGSPSRSRSDTGSHRAAARYWAADQSRYRDQRQEWLQGFASVTTSRRRTSMSCVRPRMTKRPAPNRNRAPRTLLALDLAVDEVLDGLARLVVEVLHRRRLHEVARRRQDRSTDTAVLRDLRR